MDMGEGAEEDVEGLVGEELFKYAWVASAESEITTTKSRWSGITLKNPGVDGVPR